MYEQIQNQIVQFNKQFATATLQASTLALKNAEHLISLQFKTIEERLNANVAFWGLASEARDIDGIKAVMPKGLELAKEHAERFAAVGQEMIASQLKTNQEIAELVKGQVEAANDELRNAATQATDFATKNVEKVVKAATRK
ncbi:MAG TPA: phasin family protein [Xanthomonadaceae bacterium]|jgi:hypothetical protein|nr:phasin family protein [Xanthomonadaceae bacterium]